MRRKVIEAIQEVGIDLLNGPGERSRRRNGFPTPLIWHSDPLRHQKCCSFFYRKVRYHVATVAKNVKRTVGGPSAMHDRYVGHVGARGPDSPPPHWEPTHRKPRTTPAFQIRWEPQVWVTQKGEFLSMIAGSRSPGRPRERPPAALCMPNSSSNYAARSAAKLA